MKRVLSVASESVPLVKTGGLADVVGALPGALAGQGWEMRVLLPAYRSLRAQVATWPEVFVEDDLFGGRGVVKAGDVDGVAMLLLDAPHLYDRDGGPYNIAGADWPDNPQRFAALAWVAAKIARFGLADGWRPQVLHAHDWQAGFAPAYLAFGGPRDVATVITIHNIAFQGWAPASMVEALRLPRHECHPGSLEYFGGLSSLKAAMVTADKITTVSPSYAAELMRPEFGLGLQGLIEARAADVVGILNGVDEAVWNPEAEEHAFSSKKRAGKAAARAALCAEYGLEVPGPLAIVVSRLTDQKGMDLLPQVLPDFIAAGGGLVLLGSGDATLEAAMLALAERFPGRVGVTIGYDESLSHRLFAGADAVLVPSRFEPCGLTQMYGLRYGTVPVVAAVGGLADTVIHANPAALAQGVATGLTFTPTDAPAFAEALRRLVALHADPKVWGQIIKRAMAQPVGWEASAAAYAALYESILR